MKSILPAIAIAIALCLGATQAASAQSIKRSDFLSSQQIQRARINSYLRYRGLMVDYAARRE